MDNNEKYITEYKVNCRICINFNNALSARKKCRANHDCEKADERNDCTGFFPSNLIKNKNYKNVKKVGRPKNIKKINGKSMRQCPMCKKYININDFACRSNKYRKSYCKQCLKIKAHAYYERSKIKILNSDINKDYKQNLKIYELHDENEENFEKMIRKRLIALEKYNTQNLKYCESCHEYKPLTENYWVRQRGSNDGYYAICTKCTNNKSKLRQWLVISSDKKRTLIDGNNN